MCSIFSVIWLLVQDVAVDHCNLDQPKKQFMPPFQGFSHEHVACRIVICTIYTSHVFCIFNYHLWFWHILQPLLCSSLYRLHLAIVVRAEHQNLSFVLPHQTDNFIAFHPCLYILLFQFFCSQLQGDHCDFPLLFLSGELSAWVARLPEHNWCNICQWRDDIQCLLRSEAYYESDEVQCMLRTGDQNMAAVLLWQHHSMVQSHTQSQSQTAYMRRLHLVGFIGTMLRVLWMTLYSFVDTDIFEWNKVLQKFWLQVSHNILHLTASTLYSGRSSWWTYMWHPLYLEKSGSGEYISKEWLIVTAVTWKVMLHISLFIQAHIQNYPKLSLRLVQRNVSALCK